MRSAQWIREFPRRAKALLSRARGGLRRPRPAILMYHRIADETFDPWGLAVSPANFTAQLGWLARNRTLLPLSQFAELHRVGRLPALGVAVTFDDGYSCNAQRAAPLLERLGVPATIFLPAELIERGREYWWDELERIVLEHSDRSLRIGTLEVALGESTQADRVWPADQAPRTPRHRAFHQIWSHLRTQSATDLDAAMDELRSQAPTSNAVRDSHRPLTIDEVRSTRSAIVEFGSHALTHASLTQLPTADKEREIESSIERCAAISGERPTTFAYPFGDCDAEAEQLVERSGFVGACTAEHGFVGEHTRLFALPRIQVGNWGSGRLARMLAAQ